MSQGQRQSRYSRIAYTIQVAIMRETVEKIQTIDRKCRSGLLLYTR